MKTSINILTKCPYTGNPKSRLNNLLTQDERVFLTKYMIFNILNETEGIKNTSISLWVYPNHHHVFFNEIFLNFKINLANQIGNTLNERMQSCIISESKKFENVILIGSDIPSLNKSIIQDAIEFLNESNYVLGPSRDGGFYLFGSKSSNNISLDLVKNNDFLSIQNTLESVGESYKVLQTLKDIDTKHDLLSI